MEEQKQVKVTMSAGQMRDTVSYRMKKKYTAITKAGRELASKGKVVVGKR